MTNLARLDNRLLSERVRQALLEHIHSGAYPSGRIPPEPELAKQLGVSRTSVRAALQALERDGIISRRRGVGTYVNAHAVRSRIQLNGLSRFTQMIEDAGRAADVIVEDLAYTPLDRQVAALLSAEAGTPVILVTKLLCADGKPAIHVCDIFPEANLVRRAAREDVPDSTFDFAEQLCVSPISYAVVDFIPDIASAGEPHPLELEPGEPFLRLSETHYTVANDVLGYSLIDVRDRYVRFRVVRANR